MHVLQDVLGCERQLKISFSPGYNTIFDHVH